MDCIKKVTFRDYLRLTIFGNSYLIVFGYFYLIINTLENTSVYFTEDGANYLIVGKTIIPVSEHFAETGKTVNEVIEDVIRYAVKSQKK